MHSVFLVASIDGPTPNAAVSQVFTELVRITPQLTDAGWGGYTVASLKNGSYALTFIGLLPNTTSEEANSTINPFLDFVQDVAANSTSTGNASDVLNVQGATVASFPTWRDWYESIFGQPGSEVGFNGDLGSWLIPRDTVEDDYELVAETILSVPNMNY